MKATFRSVATVAAALLLTACSAGVARSTGAASQPSTPHDRLTLALGDTSNSLVLPLTPYFPSQEQLANLLNAQDVLLSRCMQKTGFNYPVVVNEPETFGGDPGNGQFYDFGVTSSSFAKVYGYHNTTTQTPMHTVSGAPAPKLSQLPAAELTELVSCRDAVSKEAGSHLQYLSLVQQLGVQAWNQAKTNPKVVAGFRRWSACMAASGYDYANPLQALAGAPGDSQKATQWQTATPSQQEIQTAVTDVRCKDKTSLLKLWIGTLAMFQNELVQKDLPQLQAGIADFQQTLRREEGLEAQPS